MGEEVGLGEGREAVAPPGGVMLTESTAHLVKNAAVLAEAELVLVKGNAEPVPARRLLGVERGYGAAAGTESSLVGRQWEISAVHAIVEQAIAGRGCVVNVVAPPGIGKSRLAREAAALAAARGVDVFWTFCESHASGIPFHAVTRLLGAAIGVTNLDGAAARARTRQRV